jgi:hypothetical protein
MEYLMTYGWALLVIVVVGAALFALGVLNPTTYTQTRCQGFQYFSYQDQLASTTADHVSLSLVNGPQDVTITSVTWSGTALTNPTGTTATAGSKFTTAGDITLASAAADPYTNVVVTITYSVTNGIAGKVDRGTCSGIYA